ncbi:uncharacterized protein [Panulirus ornatus]|uniref:uncharacterized protein n=1 Tax=Panulirus ornatus TaxID=150431 RepID=UPI003A8C857E
MGPQWMVWILIMTLSASGEGHIDTAGKSSSNKTYHQETLPYIGLEVVTLPSPLPSQSEGEQTEPFPSVSKYGNDICVTKLYLKCSSAAYGGASNTLRRKTVIKEIHLETLDIQNAEGVSILLADAELLSQALGDVERQELRECDLVLTYDAGYSQQAKLQDLLLLYNTSQQVTRLNATQDILRMVSESSTCGDSLLPVVPEPPLGYMNNYHDTWKSQSSGRTRRSPVNTGAGGGTYCDNCSLALSLAM